GPWWTAAPKRDDARRSLNRSETDCRKAVWNRPSCRYRGCWPSPCVRACRSPFLWAEETGPEACDLPGFETLPDPDLWVPARVTPAAPYGVCAWWETHGAGRAPPGVPGGRRRGPVRRTARGAALMGRRSAWRAQGTGWSIP